MPCPNLYKLAPYNILIELWNSPNSVAHDITKRTVDITLIEIRF